MKAGAGGRREFMKGNFMWLLTASFTFGMSIHLLVPMLPGYLDSFGVAEAELGIIIGLMSFTMVFAHIPVGRFIDRRGRRGMLLFGILFLSIAPLAYTLCSETSHFVAVRLIHGIGFSAFVVTAQTMVVDLSPKGRLGEVIGLYSFAYLSAAAIGPSVSGLLLSGLGYNATFYASEIVALVAVLIAFQIKVPTHTPLPKGEGGFTSVLRNRNLMTASILLIVMMMPQGLMHSFFPLYAVDQGVGPIGIGVFFTVYALSMGGVRPFIGVLSDRIGRVAVIVPFALISGLGVASFAVLGDLAGFIVIGAMLGAGMGAAQSTLSALSVDTIKPRLRGQAVAVGGTFTVLGISMGSMSMGPVLLTGGYSATFLVTGATIFIGMAVFLIVRAVWKKKEKVYT